MPESAQRKLSLAFSVGLALLLAMGAVSLFSLWRLVAADRWVTHTLEVRSELSSVLTGLAQAEAGVRGLRITGDTTELADYHTGFERSSRAFVRLRGLTRDNLAQQRRLAALATLLDQRWRLLARAAALPTPGQVSADAVLVAREGRALTARITTLADDLDTAERALLAERTAVATRTARVASIVAVALLVLAAALALLGNRAIRRDFVGRLRAEQALRLAEQRYHVIFDQTFQLTCLLTAGGEVVDANETTLTSTGLARDELVGRGLAALPCWADEDRPAVLAAVADAAGGAFVRWEARFRRADGLEASLDLSIKPMHDERGAVHRLIVEGRDITERQAAEAALRASEAKFAGILAIAADAIITIDDAQRIVHFNRGAEEIFGYAEREMLGHSLERLIPERFRAAHDGHVARFAASGETARRMGERREVYGLRRDGSEFPAEASISVLETAGERLMTVVLRDITDRKRAESRQRFLAQAGAVLADSLEYEPTLERVARLAVPTLGELCIVDVLPADEEAASAVAHVDPEQEALVRTLRRRSPPPLDDGHPVGAVRRTGQPLLVPEIDAALLDTVAADAEQRGMLDRLAMRSALHVPLMVRGETIGVLSCLAAHRRLDEDDLALATNLAHHAALAIDNARSYLAAQRVSRARDEVLGIVSHDLRNPISAVGMCATALSAGPPAEEVARIADVIRGSAAWMQSIIRDLLDVTAIEAGRLSVRPEPTPPAIIIETLHAIHAPEAAERGVHLATTLASRATLVEADADRVVQAVGNLLANAIKFTPAGGRVTLAIEPCGEHEVAFHVTDTGPGIVADDLPRLFDRFWQARTTRRGGAGLGLAIARGIAEAHGGRIEVVSERGRGSRFTLVLRAAPSGTPTLHSLPGAGPATPSEPRR